MSAVDQASLPPLDVPYAKLDEWLESRAAVLSKKNPAAFKVASTEAPLLTRIVKHELPTLKRRQVKLTNLIDECGKRIEDAKRNAVTLKERRAERLQRLALDVADDATSTEILSALRTAAASAGPAIDAAVRSAVAACVPDAFAYFDACRRALIRDASGKGSLTAADVFPYLHAVFIAASTVALEDAAAGSVGAPESAAAGDAPVAIDWGDGGADLGGVDAAPIEIDWGSDAAATAAPIHIQWDECDVPTATAPAATTTAATTADADAAAWEWAKPHTVDARHLRPHHTATRAAMLSECDALLAFLEVRLAEEAGSTSSASAVVVSMPVARPALSMLQESVRRIADALNDPVRSELLHLTDSHVAAERFLAQQEQLLYTANRQRDVIAEWQSKLTGGAQEAETITSEVQAWLAKLHTAQVVCEGALKTLLAPRQIQIVGDINQLVA